MLYTKLLLSTMVCSVFYMALLCPDSVRTEDVVSECVKLYISKVPMGSSLLDCCKYVLECHCYLALCSTQPGMDGCANQKAYNDNCGDNYKTKCADEVKDCPGKCNNYDADYLAGTPKPTDSTQAQDQSTSTVPSAESHATREHSSVPRGGSVNVSTAGTMSSSSSKMSLIIIVLVVLVVLALLAATGVWWFYCSGRGKSSKKGSHKRSKASKGNLVSSRNSSQRSVNHHISTRQALSTRAGGSSQQVTMRSRNSLKNSRKGSTSMGGSIFQVRPTTASAQQPKMSTSKHGSFDSRAANTQVFTSPRRPSSNRFDKPTSHEVSNLKKMFA